MISGKKRKNRNGIMSKQMVISVMSKDRPGIVADITQAIYDLQGDLADLNQSVLHDYFTMILIASFNTEVTAEDIVAKFSHIKSDTKLEVVVKEAGEEIDTESVRQSDKIYIMTAQGKNKSGLVARLGAFCRDLNINILDLDTTLKDEVYTMILQIDLSNAPSIDAIHADIESFEKETELKVVMQHEDIFKITSEVNLF